MVVLVAGRADLVISDGVNALEQEHVEAERAALKRTEADRNDARHFEQEDLRGREAIKMSSSSALDRVGNWHVRVQMALIPFLGKRQHFAIRHVERLLLRQRRHETMAVAQQSGEQRETGRAAHMK